METVVKSLCDKGPLLGLSILFPSVWLGSHGNARLLDNLLSKADSDEGVEGDQVVLYS